MRSHQDVVAEVVAAIEGNGADVASRDEYDVDAIAREVADHDGSMPDDEFWTLVERHQLPARA